MKSKITILAACTLLFLSNKETLGQTNYRVNAYYSMEYDGAQFARTDDSTRTYFSGNHSFKDLYNGLDLPDYYISISTGEILLPAYPDASSILSLTADSSVNFGVNAAATAFTDPNEKSLSTFDANGNITEILVRKKSGSTWKNDTKETYTYTVDNQIRQYIRQEWASGAWVNENKEISSYNTSGQLEEFTSYYWTSGAWDNSAKHLYTYDANGNCTTSIYKEPNGSSWDNGNKTTITYNANNQPTHYLFEDWESGAWAVSSNGAVTYNSNGDILTIITQSYESGAWANEIRQTYTYTGMQKTECLQEEFDGSIWVKAIKLSYNYTSNQNLDNIILQQWDNPNSAWAKNSRLVIENNAQNIKSAIYAEVWNTGGYWEKEINSTKFKFFYESYGNTGITNLTGEVKFNIYPNPASTALSITIDWEKPATSSLTVYDITGRTCMARTLAKEAHTQAQIDISMLNEGSYYLKIATADGQITRAFQIIK